MTPYIIIIKVRKFHQPTANRFSTAKQKPVGGCKCAPSSPNRVKGFQTTKRGPRLYLQFCWQSSIKLHRSTLLHGKLEDLYWHAHRLEIRIHTVFASCASDHSGSMNLVPGFYTAWFDETGNEVYNPYRLLISLSASQLADFAVK